MCHEREREREREGEIKKRTRHTEAKGGIGSNGARFVGLLILGRCSHPRRRSIVTRGTCFFWSIVRRREWFAIDGVFIAWLCHGLFPI